MEVEVGIQTAGRMVRILWSYFTCSYRHGQLCLGDLSSEIPVSQKGAQHGQEGAVKAFHLSIPLRVVWCSLGVANPTQLFKPLE